MRVKLTIFFQLIIFSPILLGGGACSNELSNLIVEEKKQIDNVIIRGDVIVKNAYKIVDHEAMADRNVHRLYNFTIPETAESVVFSGEFQSDFDVQI